MTEEQGQRRGHDTELTQFLEEKIGTLSFDINEEILKDKT